MCNCKKYAISRSQNKKLLSPLLVGRATLSPHLTPFGASSPNFELPLTPLVVYDYMSNVNVVPLHNGCATAFNQLI